jgi:hypothetical protein
MAQGAVVSTAIKQRAGRDWQIFEDMDDAALAVEALNSGLSAAIEQIRPGKRTAEEARHAVAQHLEPVMARWAHVGAYDSEPQYAAADFINDELGTDFSRWCIL